ncbi:hypothetical protein [Bacillus sp. FJAT-44742]|uniref:hypothetical protein n=1 Tax=Bacillus sp. FJAT-44742 TaxID=2014005 RepID=UPI000C23762B|nr:hypothetical protein [Bacillus sp. FJAT-44742]
MVSLSFALLFLAVLCLLSGCSVNNSPAEELSPQSNILLFSDDENIKEENNYYNALLEVRANFPEKSDSIEVISSNQEKLLNHFNVQELPQLIIIKDENNYKRLTGDHPKENIQHFLLTHLPIKEDKNSHTDTYTLSFSD